MNHVQKCNQLPVKDKDTPNSPTKHLPSATKQGHINVQISDHVYSAENSCINKSKEAKVKCIECDKYFSRKWLKYHQKRKHRKNVSEINQERHHYTVVFRYRGKCPL